MWSNGHESESRYGTTLKLFCTPVYKATASSNRYDLDVSNWMVRGFGDDSCVEWRPEEIR